MINTKQFILERMVKIIPYEHRLYELLKYDEYWHRFDGKAAENYDKTLCGETFKSSTRSAENYKCDNIENFKDMEICLKCLQIWYEKIENEFEMDQQQGRFKLFLWDENAAFIKLFIENEGYDKFHRVVNELIFKYLEENQLLDSLEKEISENN